MKTASLALLIVIALLCLANLLTNLGVIGGGGKTAAPGAAGNWEYLVLHAEAMDQIGFGSIAKEDGKQPDAEGKVTLSREELAKDPRAYKPNLLPRTIKQIESDGGYEYVESTNDGFFIFRRHPKP